MTIYLVIEDINLFGVDYTEVRGAALDLDGASRILTEADAGEPAGDGRRVSLSILCLEPGEMYDGTATIPAYDTDTAGERTPDRSDSAPPDTLRCPRGPDPRPHNP